MMNSKRVNEVEDHHRYGVVHPEEHESYAYEDKEPTVNERQPALQWPGNPPRQLMRREMLPVEHAPARHKTTA